MSDLVAYNEVVIPKARQLGVSWLLSGYGLWKVLFWEGAKGLYISQRENEAWEMIAKSRFILEHLPAFLQVQQKHPDNRALIDFKTHDSLIEALPSTEKAGRSADATFVIRDELATHPYGAENFAAIGPTIDAGGQLIDLGTIDKLDLNNHLTDRINKILSGESNAYLIDLANWRLRPTRQDGMSLDEWFELRVKSKYSALQREQEYPENLEEALKPAKTRAFFDAEAIEAMLADTMQPLQDGYDVDTHNGLVKVFKPPAIGRKYCIFTDPSDGKDDPFATIVMDRQTFEWVATAHGKVTADMCAKIHDELVRAYNNAFNSYELNASAGGKFQQTIQDLQTPNQAPFIKPDGSVDRKKTGWWTSGQTKRKMIWGLEEAVRKRLIINHDKDATIELQGFIIPEGEEPRASGGLHDDYVMAGGGVWQIRKYMPMGGVKLRSYEYKE